MITNMLEFKLCTQKQIFIDAYGTDCERKREKRKEDIFNVYRSPKIFLLDKS